jgi:hypothetical protein
MAVRWNQWRLFTVNTFLTDGNPRLGGYMAYMNETARYPAGLNIEADQQEQRNLLHENSWLLEPYLMAIGDYRQSLTDHPEPARREPHPLLRRDPPDRHFPDHHLPASHDGHLGRPS